MFTCSWSMMPPTELFDMGFTPHDQQRLGMEAMSFREAQFMQQEEWKVMIRQQAEMKYQAKATELEVQREHLRRQHGLGHVVPPPLPSPEHPTVSAWTTVHQAMDEKDADWEAQGDEEDQPP